jgi:hypothetical protein
VPAVARVLACIPVMFLCACSGREGPVLWDVDASQPHDAGLPVDAGPQDAGMLAIALGDETTTASHGGDGGAESRDVCREAQVLVGYRGFLKLDAFIDEMVPIIGALEPICGVVRLDGSGRLLVSEAGVLPLRGEARDEAWERRCAADEVVVAFSGRSGAALDQLVLTCSGWSVRETATETTLARGPLHALEPVGGEGGEAFADGCAAGQMARGMVVKADSWIDALALVCSDVLVRRE